MVDEALTAADGAAWAALCNALAEYHETAVLLRLVVRSAPADSLAFQDAVYRARSAWQNLEICWMLHYGVTLPATPLPGR